MSESIAATAPGPRLALFVMYRTGMGLLLIISAAGPISRPPSQTVPSKSNKSASKTSKACEDMILSLAEG